MTLEEAIKILDVNVICSPKAFKFRNAVDVATVALKKQIPMKPKDEGWLYCPVCGKDVCVDKPEYCSDCGQKLDWSD